MTWWDAAPHGEREGRGADPCRCLEQINSRACPASDKRPATATQPDPTQLDSAQLSSTQPIIAVSPRQPTLSIRRHSLDTTPPPHSPLQLPFPSTSPSIITARHAALSGRYCSRLDKVGSPSMVLASGSNLLQRMPFHYGQLRRRRDTNTMGGIDAEGARSSRGPLLSTSKHLNTTRRDDGNREGPVRRRRKAPFHHYPTALAHAAAPS